MLLLTAQQLGDESETSANHYADLLYRSNLPFDLDRELAYSLMK
jgi:hypothetical protein